MKKIYGRIVAIITAVALVFSMVGCGQKKAVEDDKLKVALLIMSNLGDEGFYDSANSGMKLIAGELGAEIKTIEMGRGPSKCEPYLRDVAEQDRDYITVGSSPAVEVAEILIPQYPDKKFIMFDTEVDWSEGDFKNLYCAQYKQNEGGLLAGAVAAIMTTEGKNANLEKIIGCIGGGDLPIINNFMLGYIRGAQYVEPDIKVAASYAGTFVDSTKGKELALPQMNQQKMDICYQIASQTGIDVLNAAKEFGLYATGVDGDQAMALRDSDPAMAEVIATSMMKRVGQFLLRAAKMAEEGALTWGQTEVVGLKELGVGVAYGENFERELPAENQQLVKDLEQKIINGEIVVDSTIGIDIADLAIICNEVAP